MESLRGEFIAAMEAAREDGYPMMKWGRVPTTISSPASLYTLNITPSLMLAYDPAKGQFFIARPHLASSAPTSSSTPKSEG